MNSIAKPKFEPEKLKTTTLHQLSSKTQRAHTFNQELKKKQIHNNKNDKETLEEKRMLG